MNRTTKPGGGSPALALAPGTLVRHPERPDWGIGQIQSVIGNRITVNFEHEGKKLILGDRVLLVAVDNERGEG